MIWCKDWCSTDKQLSVDEDQSLLADSHINSNPIIDRLNCKLKNFDDSTQHEVFLPLLIASNIQQLKVWFPSSLSRTIFQMLKILEQKLHSHSKCIQRHSNALKLNRMSRLFHAHQCILSKQNDSTSWLCGKSFVFCFVRECNRS
jgi:hypothetical protein